MSELSIGRLTATVADWPDPEAVPPMLQRVAAERLDGAVRAHSLPEGEWCVRRVDLNLELDPERPSNALESDWADQIVIALRQSLRDGTRSVVHYERREQALDDVLAGLATEQHDRAWAWRQVGLLVPDDPRPDADARALCLRVLGRLPHGVAGALCRLVRHVGPAAAHRLLGVEGWAECAAHAASEAGASLPALTTTDGPDAAGPSPTRTTRAPTASAGTPSGQTETEDNGRRAQAVAAVSLLAAPLRGSGLRVGRHTLDAWAVLVLAEADPAALRHPDAAALVAAVARLLRAPVASGLALPQVPTPSRPLSSPRLLADASAATTPAAAVSSARAAVGDNPAGQRLPEAVTAWGGLLFLLNTAADVGLPQALQEPPFHTRPVGWLIQQCGIRLAPAAADDPAVLALGGLDPGLAAAPAPDDTEAAALDLLARRWGDVTAARLRTAAPDDRGGSVTDLVRWMASRDAVVVREPGWVEVRLRLDDVDLDVRRAGLDIDPGWVSWLGQVVRFSYE